MGQLLTFSKHKFASNVVEKSIQFGTEEQRRAIVAQLMTIHSDGSSPLQLMMKDQYGNYVVRKFSSPPFISRNINRSPEKLLAQLKGPEREEFVEHVRPQLIQLKKYNYGKQLLAIEKLISLGPQYSAAQSSIITSNNQTMPIEINSNAPTPMLTNGQNSPQSSSLPSTNVSTIDDPADVGKMLEISSKPCPEVIINGI
jgi:mRNA-binding protein PUF3